MSSFIDSILLPSSVETGLARRILPHIAYNGKDISDDLSNYLTGISYTDELTGSADDLQLTLEDKDGLWLSEWFPEKGATLDAVLESRYWNHQTDGPEVVSFGTFEIDEIECSAMPSEVSIKAVSVPDNTTLRGAEHSRAWEKVTVHKVAEDIATGAGMELFWDSEDETTEDRIEQTEQSDLEFLQKLCDDHNLALKISAKKIVIFDLQKYEDAEAVINIVRDPMLVTENMMTTSDGVEIPSYEITSWRLRSSVRDVYRACRVEYQNEDTKEKISYTFTAPDKTVGKTLVVNQQVKSQAEAEKLARAELRKKNAEEQTGSVTLRGQLTLSAGLTVNLFGYGVFDGKYLITRVQHDIGSSGYTCSLDIRRCLEGY